jgi:hypothetical protein
VTSVAKTDLLQDVMGSTNTTLEFWVQFNQSFRQTNEELLIMSIADQQLASLNEEASSFCDYNMKVIRQWICEMINFTIY